MRKTAAPELPANMKEFYEITGVVLAECHKVHPMPASVRADRIARVLGVSTSDIMPSKHTFQDVCVHTLDWLKRQGFITEVTIGDPGEPPGCTLTDKTLGGIKPFGAELVDAADKGSSEAGKQQIAELVGNFLGAYTGSAVKSLSGS